MLNLNKQTCKTLFHHTMCLYYAPSIFEKHKICLSPTKSLLIVN